MSRLETIHRKGLNALRNHVTQQRAKRGYVWVYDQMAGWRQVPKSQTQ